MANPRQRDVIDGKKTRKLAVCKHARSNQGSMQAVRITMEIRAIKDAFKTKKPEKEGF